MNTKTPEVDAFIERAETWRDETVRLRSVLLHCGLVEAFKWRKPCYTFEGKNVAIIQGFKNHCALMFFKGSLLKDHHGLLVSQGSNSQAAMRMEFTGAEQVDGREAALRDYVEQAIELERRGVEVEFTAKDDLELPKELTAMLDEDPEFAEAFQALTPGRQRAYVLHVSSAKHSSTRTARIERSVEKILSGEGPNER